MTYNKANKTFIVSRNTMVAFSAGTLLTIAMGLISATTTFSNLRNQVSSNSGDIVELKEATAQLQADNTTAKVEFSKIQTQLTAIQANILDIKERLSANGAGSR